MLMHNEENQTPSRLIFEGKACSESDADVYVEKNPSESCGYKCENRDRKF